MKKVKITKLICLVVCMFLSLQVVAVTDYAPGFLTNPEDKIQPDLRAIMATADDEKIPVWLWFTDIDHDEAKKIVYERTGLNESNVKVINEQIPDDLAAGIVELGNASSDAKEVINAAFEGYMKRTEAARNIESERTSTYLHELYIVQKELLCAQNKACSEKIGLSSDDIIRVFSLLPVCSARLSKDAIERISYEDCVESIAYNNPNNKVIVSESEIQPYINATSLSRVRTEQSQLTGSGVKIGIIDSGYVMAGDEIDSDRLHIVPLGSNPNFNHATRVATVAAGASGVAPSAQIYSICGYDADIETYQDNCAAAIESLADLDVHVANISLGFDRYTDDPLVLNYYTELEKAIDYYVKENHISLTIAAGNAHGVITSPGLAYNAITVGGFFNCATATTTDDVLYWDNNYNNGTGCMKPDLLADQFFFDGTSTGTSFAAPFAAGTIALLFQLRPSLAMDPEAVKAILMASCHRKVAPNPPGDPVETMSEGLTDHQGAGVMDPYRAIAIAGSGNYGVRIIPSTESMDHIWIEQPAYGSTGLNFSVSWLTNPISDEISGPSIDLDLTLYRNGQNLGTSTNENSSSEMIYVTPSASQREHYLSVGRMSAAPTAIQFAYAFSVDQMRFQYTSVNEGIFRIRNQKTGYYMTQNLVSNSITQQARSLYEASQRWVITNERITSATTNNGRLAIGNNLLNGYSEAIANTSNPVNISIFSVPIGPSTYDGAVSIMNWQDYGVLDVYEHSALQGAQVAWTSMDISDEYQKWYLEPVSYWRGDVDMDGDIDSNDYVLLGSYMSGLAYFADYQVFLADLDGNGVIDATDSSLLYAIIWG